MHRQEDPKRFQVGQWPVLTRVEQYTTPPYTLCFSLTSTNIKSAFLMEMLYYITINRS